jgi:hypothetical protein
VRTILTAADTQRVTEWFHNHNTNVFDELTHVPTHSDALQSIQLAVRPSAANDEREVAVMRCGLVPH